MNSTPDDAQAYWLTLGMGRVAGANLPAAVFDGWLSRTELATLVTRCARCNQVGRCTGWLSTAFAASHVPLPAWCPNAAEIEGLSMRCN